MNIIGRNDPCYCGSGRKHKKCHLESDKTRSEGSKIPSDKLQNIQIYQEVMKRRQDRFGKGRSAITSDFRDHKLVAVGSRLYYSKSWRTFPDFLMEYPSSVLGVDWGNTEIAKPLQERHQIMQWYDGLCRWQRQSMIEESGLYSGVLNGVAAAYVLLSYDLYTINHNARLQEEIIRRLKINDLFQGARYELTVAATMVRAGFEIHYENERDRSKKHPEFIATHKITGQFVSVEAKSRHRPGALGYPGIKQTIGKADVGKLLTQAILKQPNYPYVVFIDLNLPPLPKDWTEKLLETQLGKELAKTVERAGGYFKDGKDPFNTVIFTNFPHHYGKENEMDPPKHHLAFFSQKPRHITKTPDCLLSIHTAMQQYGRIPNDFTEA